MQCVSIAPLTCDTSCCSVDVKSVTAKSCYVATDAVGPAPGMMPGAGAAPSPAPTAVYNGTSVDCSSSGCTLNGTTLSTAGITTTGSYTGLWTCFTPPTTAPVRAATTCCCRACRVAACTRFRGMPHPVVPTPPLPSNDFCPEVAAVRPQITPIDVNATLTLFPATLSSGDGRMQCVTDTIIFCETSCCRTGSGKIKSCIS